jgi:tripartite-type tricarboxylate transporter receptor subunit TctC
MLSLKGNRAASFLVLTLVLTMLAGCALPGSQSGPSPEEFYNGKVLTIITGSPGGGLDAYPRLAAPFLKKYMPGITVVVENMGGGGMLTAHNAIYTAKPDGLTIGMTNPPGAVFTVAAGNVAVQYDLTKFTWLARASAEGRVIVAGVDDPVKSANDMMTLGNQGRPFRMGFSGIGSDDYYIAFMVFDALGIPMAAMPGYAGLADSILGVMRGEIDGIQGTNSSMLAGIDNGTLRPILILADEYPSNLEPQMKGVTLAGSLVKDPAKKAFLTSLVGILAMDRSFAGPPGIPADRVKYLRDAFKKTFNDPEFLDQMAKAKRPTGYLEGEKLADLVTASMKSVDSFKASIASSMAK